jgi:glucosyl-dolichyl phosphate glucuronosyltransferase
MVDKVAKEISIIIATRNRCRSLRDVLEDLLRMNTGGLSYEIIVSDNNSTDQTKEVVREYQSKLPGRIVYLFEPKRGKSFAINHALRHANGEILFFIDDDTRIAPDWLVNLRECFIKYSCDVVGGRVLPLFNAQTPQWIKDNSDQLFGPVVHYDYGTEDRLYDPSEMRQFVGCNMAIKKSILRECGGFRVDMGPGQGFIGEDTELIDRIYKINKSLYYCGRAQIWHPLSAERANFKYMANWFIQIGRFRVRAGTFAKEPLVYWGGVPRYLFRAIFHDMLNMLLHAFDCREFLRHFALFFIKLGGIKEYRLSHLSLTKKRTGCKANNTSIKGILPLI